MTREVYTHQLIHRRSDVIVSRVVKPKVGWNTAVAIRLPVDQAVTSVYDHLWNQRQQFTLTAVLTNNI